MKDVSLGRRSALSALGVVVGASLVGSVTVAEAATLLVPVAVPLGLRAREYRVTGASAVEHGAFFIALSDSAGDSFRVDVCARDDASDAPRGPARTRRFDFFLSNAGSGSSPTDERHGLATMALAAELLPLEGELEVSGLMTLRDRLSIHAERIAGR